LVSDRKRWVSALVVTTAIALPLLAYALINDRLYPHAGLTAVSNINLLGKILEYNMEREGDAARFPALWQAANSLPADNPSPYLVQETNPAAVGKNWEDAGQFSQDIVRHHPLEYGLKSARDLVQGWLTSPYTFAPVDASLKTMIWTRLSTTAYDAYILLPLAIIALVGFWRRIERRAALGIATLGVGVGFALITTALFGYVDIARLRTPIDPLALVFVIAVGTQLITGVRQPRT
jgi:hypothetical protein